MKDVSTVRKNGSSVVLNIPADFLKSECPFGLGSTVRWKKLDGKRVVLEVL